MRQPGAAIDRLEADIRNLKIEFERFFNGSLPVPPEDLRVRVFDHLRSLRSVHWRSAVDRFRLGSLEARLNSLNELVNRRLRNLEQAGRPARDEAGAKRSYDPYRGVVMEKEFDSAAAEALYNELYGRNGRTDLETFSDFLRRQTAKIRRRTGCNQVQFRVASERGKLTLKAKGVESPSS